MREYYFRTDPYARDLETEIVDITENQVILKDTIFYPGGGGQPPDTGKIAGLDFDADIINVRKQEDLIVHTLANIHGTLKKEKVRITLDWDRRYALMKAHTGEHILYRTIELLYPVKFEKVAFQPEESVLLISGDINFKQVKEAEYLANKTIAEGRDIRISFQSSDAITSEIRLNKGRIKDESIRIVEIEGFDKSACTGIHVSNTREVDMVVATKLKRAKYLEIYFMVGDYARVYMKNIGTDIYEMEQLLGAHGPELLKKIYSMKSELETLKENYYDISAKMYTFNVTNLKNLNFYYSDSGIGNFKGVEKRAQDIISRENSIVLYGNDREEKIFLLFSKSVSIDLKKLNALLEHYSLKGGGKGNFFLFYAPSNIFKPLIEEIRKFIIEEIDKPL